MKNKKCKIPIENKLHITLYGYLFLKIINFFFIFSFFFYLNLQLFKQLTDFSSNFFSFIWSSISSSAFLSISLFFRKFIYKVQSNFKKKIKKNGQIRPNPITFEVTSIKHHPICNNCLSLNLG